MAHQKVKAPKPVKVTKAWALIDDGKILPWSVRSRRKDCLGYSKYFPPHILKWIGYRCIKVQILPLTK